MTQQYLALIEAEIKREKFGKSPQSLYEPIRYIMALGGKRLRPLLTMLSYALYKNDARRIARHAVAVEAFHNFTLLHDDIMDNAPLRRGKMTVHEKWNVNTAILSGDVMLVKVYDRFLDLPPALLTEVLTLFNRCAAEVCEGQQWDMEFEQRTTVTPAEYLMMIRLKTAVLLGFSLELGALLAGASAADRAALREFGVNIGLGFQLKDDWLDVYADKKKFGKQVGGDIIANKKTFLLIEAQRKAKGAQRNELASWLRATKFNRQEKVKAVTAIYDALGVGASTERKINFFFNKGFACLSRLAPSPERDKLQAFVEALIQREA